MKICIIDACIAYVDETSLSKSLGGSETWLLQISNEFVKRGHTVAVICKTKHQLTAPTLEEGKVNFCNVYWIRQFLKDHKFDAVIINRSLNYYDLSFINLAKESGNSNIFIQVHDLSIPIGDGSLITKENTKQYITDADVRGIVCLNDWHKNNLALQVDYPENKLFTVPNGIDFTLFPTDIQKTKPHRIFWSSCPDRGLSFLVGDIYNRVKPVIPDFGVDVAGYGECNIRGAEGRDIHLFGKMSKADLYKEMSTHSFWFYPCTFAETFCLTALENIMCGVMPICPFLHGMSTLLPEDLRDEIKTPAYKIVERDGKQYIDTEDLVNNASERIISLMTDPIKHEEWLAKAQEYIRSTYTWENVAICWEELLKP